MADNDTDPCFTHWYEIVGKQADYFVYQILTPIYFILGTLGHGICILAFLHQAKNEQAYVYQIFVTTSEAMLVITNTLYVYTFILWSGLYEDNPGWYASCYACVWVSANIFLGVSNAFLISTQFFSICMSYDRFRALHNPIKYKSTTKKGYVLVFLTSIFIGFAASFFQFFEFDVVPNEHGGYKIAKNAFTYGIWKNVFSQIRNVVIIGGLIALYFFNVAIPVLYRKRLEESKKVIPTAVEEQRKRKARMLTILSMSEAIFVTLGNTAFVMYYIYVGVKPDCFRARLQLYDALMDGTAELTSLLNFYVLFFISREFRGMIRKTLLRVFGGEQSSSAVGPTG